jgi:hypothetical protein
MHRDGRGLALPILLIAAGVIFLLVNTGAIPAAALQRLGDLWPILLIILGLQLVFNHTLGGRRAQLAGMLAALFIASAAIAFAILAPAEPAGASQVLGIRNG